MEEGKIGNIEMLCLIANAISCKVFFISIAQVIDKVGTAGWYMTLISMAVALAFFSLVVMLIKAYPGKNILEIYDEVTGKTFGKILAIVSCIILMFSTSITVREFIYATKIYHLKDSPTGYVTALFVVSIVIVCCLGIEGMARTAKLFSYILLFSFIMVLFLSFKRYELHRIFPLLGYGLTHTVKNGIIRSSAYGEIILLGIFAGALNDTKDVGKIGYKTIILVGAIVSTTLLSIIGGFPYFIARELSDPLYILVSLIDYGRFFQRIDVLFIFTWNLSTLVGMTAVFYGVVIAYAHAFEIKDKRPIIIAFAIILYILVLMIPSTAVIIDVLVPMLRNLGWIGFYMPIFITWIIWFFFKRRKEIDTKKN